MNRKNRAIVALAVAAMIVAFGSSAARCVLDWEADRDRPQADQPAEQAEGLSMASLVGTEWILEGGDGEMSIVGGAFVEGRGTDAEVTYFTVDEESPTDTGLTASVFATKDVTAGGRASVVQVSSTGNGGMRLVCDALKGAYVSKPATSPKVSISGAGPELESSMGTPASLMEEAISAFASERHPYATSATWEKEVWIDFGHDRASTTFVLDDPSATVVTVLVEDGSVEVL